MKHCEYLPDALYIFVLLNHTVVTYKLSMIEERVGNWKTNRTEQTPSPNMIKNG